MNLYFFMDVPGLHQHKVYGMVCSQVPWKQITQSKKSPKYQRVTGN